MPRKPKLSEQKRKKAESARLKVFDINFGEFQRLSISQHLKAQLRPKSVYLCLFHFYTEFFIFHASVASGLRQAVCKTVAVYALEVQIFPDAPIQFWILDFEF